MLDVEQSILDLISKDPARAAKEIERLDCEESLLDYARFMWPIIEPGRQLKTGWVLEGMCESLEEVTAGSLNGRGILFNVPPGFMKSLLVNVFWPSWEWGPKNMAWVRYFSLSYSEKLTIRDNKRFRHLIKSEEYQAHWGDRFDIAADEDNFEKIGTTTHGFKRAGSTMGQIMGDRADRILLDDPNNTAKTDSDADLDRILMIFSEVLPTRVNDENSVFVVIMQRVHERDVSGHILANELDYEHFMIPMEFEPERRCTISYGNFTFTDPRKEDGELAFPERFARKQVEGLKKAMRSEGGEFAVAGQFQQRPRPRGGGMFKEDDFDIIDVCPPLAGSPVRGWDLAGSKKKRSKRTAGVKMARAKDGRIVIMHAVTAMKTPGGVKALIKNLCETDDEVSRTRCDMPQDPGQAGIAQKVDYISFLDGHDVKFTPESGSKTDRAGMLAAQTEAKNVVLLRGAWNNAFIKECCDFPTGTYTDQVDAASRAYAALSKKREQIIPGAPKIYYG